MGRRERAVFGGLLTGLGQGLTERSDRRIEEERRKREDMIALLAEKRLFKHQRGLLASTEPDEFGNVKAITRGGDVTDLGFKAARKGSTESGISAGDARLLADAKARYTTDSILEGEVVDWKSVDAYLAAKGRPDLAAPRSISTDTSIDKTSPEWLSAKKDAEKWGKDQERFWSFDTTVFEQYGGETQAIRDKTMEYYLADKGVDSGGSRVSGTPAGGSKQAGSSQYPTEESVGEAYRNGVISKAEVERILREKFGY